MAIGTVKQKDLYGGNNYCFCSLERFEKKYIGPQCVHVSGVNHVSLKNVVIMKRVSPECSVALKSFDMSPLSSSENILLRPSLFA